MEMDDELQVEYDGLHYLLRREQWKGKTAKISACDELLEEIKRHCWTLRGSQEHPYLSTKANGKAVYLHAFVLQWLYGKGPFAELIRGMVIDHLDNDGLNCCFENLCVTTDTNNVMKGRGIDKAVKLEKIPDYIIGVFYLHDQGVYQMQVAFNRAKLFCEHGQITRLYLKYQNRGTLISDWYYLKNCLIDEILPDYNRLRADRLAFRVARKFENIPEGQYVFEKDGGLYGVINPDAGDHAISIVKTEVQPINWDAVEETIRKAQEDLSETIEPVSDAGTNV